MQALTDARDAQTPDELWFLEHEPVFTQGLNGKPEHLLAPATSRSSASTAVAR